MFGDEWKPIVLLGFRNIHGKSSKHYAENSLSLS